MIAEVARMGIEGAQCEVRTIAVALAYFESHRKQFPTRPEKTGFVAVFFFTRTILDTELFLSFLENGFGPGTTEVLYVCTFGCENPWAL